MPERNHHIYVIDILESINRIENYVKDMEYDVFAGNNMVIDAVLRNLEIIGEASRHIPDDIKFKYANIPWRKIIGLRNIVIHEYFGVDLENIWKIIKENIPSIKPYLERMVEE